MEKRLNWTKDEIWELLKKSDKAVKRALRVLTSLQTNEEREIEATIEANGVGFNERDAKLLQSFDRQMDRRGFLSQKQLDLARAMLKKYSGQLARVANGGIAVEA